MFDLLQELVKGLLAHQHDPISGIPNGALFCQYHNHHHTRGGEASFPIVFLAKEQKDDALLQKGLELADWLVSRQNPNGSWDETPDTWQGTTVFQLIALAAIMDIGCFLIDTERKNYYGKAVRKAADWVYENIRFRKVTTNYVATGAAGLALANKIYPQKKWKRKSRKLAQMAASSINKEGLVKGEGIGRRILKKIYIRPSGIDIGYGLEMTLAALALYTVITRDRDMAKLVHFAIRSHLYFIYPDGSLDNSLGSRGYKWTVYGSKTAHGSQMALAFAAPDNPEILLALRSTTESLKNHIKNGLLGDGPAKDIQPETQCLYPTIMRASNLAFALCYFSKPKSVQIDIPDEKPVWIKKWSSLNSVVLCRHPWKATISGYSNFTRFNTETELKNYYVPGGGSITYLFNHHWGVIQAASQLEYQQIERLHVPMPNSEIQSMTPRIVIRGPNRKATSAHARKTKILFSQANERIIIEVSGHFFYINEIKRSSKSYFKIKYLFTAKKLTKQFYVKLERDYHSLEIIEPIVVNSATEIKVTDTGALLSQNSKQLFISTESISGYWSFPSQEERITCPLPALKGLSICCTWKRPVKGEYHSSINLLPTD